jgi:hypothetical protein
MRNRSTGTRICHWQKDEDEEDDNLIYLNSCGFSLKLQKLEASTKHRSMNAHTLLEHRRKNQLQA